MSILIKYTLCISLNDLVSLRDFANLIGIKFLSFSKSNRNCSLKYLVNYISFCQPVCLTRASEYTHRVYYNLGRNEIRPGLGVLVLIYDKLYSGLIISKFKIKMEK